MKNWRVLLTIEYEWRVFRIYRKVINRLIKKRMKLSSPILCGLNRRLSQHSIMVTKMKDLYEKQTGHVILFYKCDDY